MKEEKKVEFVELIYDLIFVYMVGRDNALIEDVRSGFVSEVSFLAYILCTLSIIQIWTFSTFYINMFGRNGWRDHIFLLSNMYLMYFIGEATRMDAAPYIMQYHIAWALMLANVGLQYVIELRNHKLDVWNRGIIQGMSIALFTEAGMVFIASFLGFYPAMYLSYAAIFTGILLTFIGRKTSIGGQVDFMHLTERAMLYVVFTFGEMVIVIASYFTGGGKFDLQVIYYSLLTFLIAVGLFLSYEIIYNDLLDREGSYGGMLYMILHIFILFMLNNLTVSFAFMRESQIATSPKVMFLTFSLIFYFLFLFLLGGHFKSHCRPDKRFTLGMVISGVAFALLMYVFRGNMAVNIAISLLYTYFVVAVLYRIRLMTQEA